MELTREQILNRKPKRKVVEVPEWGGEVTIQAFSVGAAQAMSSEDGIVELVMRSVINSQDGTPKFAPEDKESLRELEFATCKRVADEIIEFNGMSKQSVEVLAKNSETGPNGASSSA